MLTMIILLVLYGSAALLIYTFVGYPALLWLRARFWPRPVNKSDFQPTVTFIIAAHNEERVIRRKLDSIFCSSYPADRLQVIVVSDGSEDATNDILMAYNDRRLIPIVQEERRGKAAALNTAVRHASGEIVIFTDARQVLEKDCLRNLISNFADLSVGCVSGQLMLGDIDRSAAISGEQLKWRLENKIREWEGATGSVVGALGAFNGARRRLVVDLPEGTLLDDCYIPLNIVRQRYRTVFEKDARVWDDVVTTPTEEFRRKVRTLTGNYQLIRLAPWLLSPRNPVWFGFFSHKLCRLAVPFLLIALLATSWAAPGLVYRIFGALQIGAYALGLLAIRWPRFGTVFKPAEIARSVLVLSAATLIAFGNFITSNYGVWMRAAASNRGEKPIPAPVDPRNGMGTRAL